MSDRTAAIKTFIDPSGRPQTSVTGPKGHFLVTRHNDRAPYEVWCSDSINTLLTTSDKENAIAAACRAAGVPG